MEQAPTKSLSSGSESKEAEAADGPSGAINDEVGGVASAKSPTPPPRVRCWGEAFGMKVSLMNLHPAQAFEFRVRACSHFGWSEFSLPSPPLSSSPTPPSPPQSPFASYCAGDALWVNWVAPTANGSPILGYELKWRRALDSPVAASSCGNLSPLSTGGSLTFDVVSSVLVGFNGAEGNSEDCASGQSSMWAPRSTASS